MELFSFCFSPICTRLPRRVSAEDSQDPEDAETSGVRVLLASPDALEAKDKEVWCTVEELLAMLLVGVKVGGWVGGYALLRASCLYSYYFFVRVGGVRRTFQNETKRKNEKKSFLWKVGIGCEIEQ